MKYHSLEFSEAFQTLSEEYPLVPSETRESADVVLESGLPKNDLEITRSATGQYLIRYGSKNLALRGLGWVLATEQSKQDSPLQERIAAGFRETMQFDTFGILLDCTRGNIMTVDYFKHWLRQLALLGYNMAMIYTKDAYLLPNEPYFGFMRGAYSLTEMREIDQYAASLGIEMVASIQALGHLEPIMRWPAYGKISDTSSAILVDEPESYKLIEKMLDFWHNAFKSRRIHLGMDETHDLGRGRFMDLHGYENPFSIYNRHLERVCKMCKERAMRPIIWSDMYFRYTNKNQDYYDLTSQVPEEVKQAIPNMVQLSYWDYYHREPNFYETMLKRTSQLNGSAPFMASGIWTWATMWCDYEQTKATVSACLKGCKLANAKEIVFALWGDDGGYCEFDSAFAGIAWTSCQATGTTDDKQISVLHNAVCKSNYDRQLQAGQLEFTYTDQEGNVKKIRTATLLWDDPLMGIVRHEVEAIGHSKITELIDNYQQVKSSLEGHMNEPDSGNIKHAHIICNTLIQKLKFREALTQAYSVRNKTALEELATTGVNNMIQSINDFQKSFEDQWNKKFKPYGLELMQIRLGGLKERYLETRSRIMHLLNNDIARIEELEVKHHPIGYIDPRYIKAATGSFFI